MLAGFFLVPFSRLWGQMPPIPPEPAVTPTAIDPAAVSAVALTFGVPSLAPFCLFVWFPRQAWGTRLSPLVTTAAVGVILLPAVVSLATYPCCTSDVLDYVNRQRLWVVHGGNPYAVVPNDHPEDWSYYFASFKDSVFGYGPAWWLIARAFTQWASGLDAYLLGFKALAAVCFAVSAALIWRLADGPGRLMSLAFFAWNPVVLIDGVLRLHNDLMTVPFVLAGLWLWQRRPSSSLLLVTLGALVKVTVAPLLLVFAAGILRTRRWRALILGVLGCAVLVAALYAPFWVGPGTFSSLVVQANRPQWSFGDALLYASGPWLGPAALPTIRVLLAAGCALVVALVVGRGAAQTPPADTGVLVILASLLCLPLAFYSHYLTPVIALAALASDARLRWLVLAVAFGAMVNAVLGVDSLAGGLTGAVLDITGSVVMILAVAFGIAPTLRLLPAHR